MFLSAWNSSIRFMGSLSPKMFNIDQFLAFVHIGATCPLRGPVCSSSFNLGCHVVDLSPKSGRRDSGPSLGSGYKITDSFRFLFLGTMSHPVKSLARQLCKREGPWRAAETPEWGGGNHVGPPVQTSLQMTQLFTYRYYRKTSQLGCSNPQNHGNR